MFTFCCVSQVEGSKGALSVPKSLEAQPNSEYTQLCTMTALLWMKLLIVETPTVHRMSSVP